jgi:hypothetical protein
MQSARTDISHAFRCPTDVGPVIDETGDPARARARGSYRGCVGDGDVYNDPLSPTGAGLFQVRPGQRFGSPSAPVQVRLIDYTGTHDVPGIVRHFFQASGRSADIQAHTPGGTTLEDHFTGGGLAQIQAGPWDYVFLQEQSMRPILARPLMHQFAHSLDAEAKKQGARTVFYMTRARAFLPETQPQLTNAYQSIARELGADVAPVGIAWENVLKSRPDIGLHDSDGSDPTLAGAYLAACVFYAYLTGASPEGLPNETPSGAVPPEHARYLQKMAAGGEGSQSRRSAIMPS